MAIQNKSKVFGLSLIVSMGLASALNAGIIGPVVDQADPAQSSGFGGWNLDNVDVLMTDDEFNPAGFSGTGEFNETTGSYPTMTYGDSFESRIKDENNVTMAALHGKNWPVGEPAGIKIINSNDRTATFSHNKPASCIMTTSFLEGTYLDSDAPQETLCNSDFQTHKRFKVNMLPSMVEGAALGEYGNGVELVFNVAGEGGTRRYQVLQKINNYTGVRLDGYKIEIGFGQGADFVTVSEHNSSLPPELKLSIGEDENVINEGEVADIWGEDELATFSHGLFGPQTYEVPDPHFPTDGFFDKRAAGFYVTLNHDANDTITSNGALPSHYVEAPAGFTEPLFGDWLPSIWEPVGIFYDHDNNPSTDAELQAFWGWDPVAGEYGWMLGNNDGFETANDQQLLKWATQPGYNMDAIEDVLNLGLNYIVEIGNIAYFPTFHADAATFTIRITPHLAATNTKPGYIDNPPPALDYNSSTGIIAIAPQPYFPLESSLTIRVSDTDLNTDANTVQTVDINVTNDQGQDVLVTLTELGADTSVFEGRVETTSTSGSATLYATTGTIVTATYIDANSDDGVDYPRITTTTAGDAPVSIPPSNNDTADGFSTMDNVSLFAMIFGFLAIGGFIARKRLAK